MRNAASGIQQLSSIIIGVAAVLALIPASSLASTLTFYNSRAALDTAEPGLPLEDFLPINSPGLVGSPLSSTANNSNFPAGNILPGITFTEANGFGLYTYNGAVGPFGVEDTLTISFNPGVFAFATDVFGGSGSAPLAGTLTMDVFDGTADLAPPTNFATLSGQTDFIGFSSTTQVTSVQFTFQPANDALSGSAYVDNVAFGSKIASTPEPSTAALSLLAVLLFGIGAATRRTRC